MSILDTKHEKQVKLIVIYNRFVLLNNRLWKYFEKIKTVDSLAELGVIGRKWALRAFDN